MKRIFTSLSLLCSLSLLAGPLQAATLSESEPNDSLAASQVLPALTPGDTLYTISGAKTDSTLFTGTADDSADYFQFFANAGDYYSFEALVTSADPSSLRDTLLYLYDAAGNVLAFDDNSGTDGGSRISFYRFAASGSYTIAVSGFGDPGDLDNGGNGVLVGGGDTNFAYDLTIAQVPEPTAAPGLLLAAAGLGGLVWRRRVG